MKASIYFIQFLKDDAASVGGGGIGTLISRLCPLLEELGHEVTVYQCSGRAFDVRWGNTRVVGIPVYPGPGGSNEKVAQRLRDLSLKEAGRHEIEIFAGDYFSVKNNNPYAICVQNGLSWDADIRLLTNSKIYHTALGEKIFRYRCQMRGLRRFETCHNRVAVDLNFLNWYRSFRGPSHSGRIFYNPNPAPLAAWDIRREKVQVSGEPLRIIFARRLVPEKGTRMITEVFSELLRIRPNLRITFAGEGPDSDFLRRTFSGDSRVTLTTYETADALKVHQEHDIAVIPSLCGEATCLSVLEAMAAGCAVVATNMGGTITEIIDGYNGLLCFPERRSVLDKLLYLIDNMEERKRISRQGWEVSQRSYPEHKWRSNWVSIIETVIQS